MDCRCFIVRQGITVGAWETCTNWDLHAHVRGESPIGHGVTIARQIAVALHAKKAWASVDAVAAQLAWWLPSSPTNPLPGNACREPEELATARLAADAPSTDVRDAIRAQIDPDLRLLCATWRYPRRHSPASSWRRDGGRWHRSPSSRQIAREIQAEASSGEWHRHSRHIPAESVTLNVATENVPAGLSIGWAMGAKVVKVESNTITLDRALKGDEFKRLALDVPKRSGKTRYPPNDKDRGRAFLLSKQRRQHRGAR